MSASGGLCWFIINVPGRGYSFVASVELSERENRARPTRAIATLV